MNRGRCSLWSVVGAENVVQECGCVWGLCIGEGE
jgi:hypothetical protein